MENIKCITFDKEAQDNLPQEIKDRMKADREMAQKKQPIEMFAGSFTLHGPGCIGCQKHGKAAMLSVQVDGESRIIDIFLNEHQVEYLIKMVNQELLNH